MKNDLKLTVEERPGSVAILKVGGELDVATAPQFRDKLLEIVGQMFGRVVVDLTPVEFIDSSALGVILNAWKQLKAQDATLVVVSPKPRISRIFEITGLALSIRVCSSIDEALGLGAVGGESVVGQ